MTQLIDDTAAANDALRAKLTDAFTPGYQVECDPDEAESIGAFQEDALSEKDAAESAIDLAALDEEETPTFISEGGPHADLPISITLDAALGRKTATEG